MIFGSLGQSLRLQGSFFVIINLESAEILNVKG